jgi:hypothetical protein
MAFFSSASSEAVLTSFIVSPFSPHKSSLASWLALQLVFPLLPFFLLLALSCLKTSPETV